MDLPGPDGSNEPADAAPERADGAAEIPASDVDAAEESDGGFGTDRLEAFSDGVMAVIITIMAFSLTRPSGFTLSSVTQLIPGLLVYILSFTFVGIYWNNHHHLLRSTYRVSGAVMWANLHLLFWLSLLPVMTAWVGHDHDYDHSVPAAGYGVVALGAAIAYWILVRTIIGANERNASVATAVGSDLKGKISIVVYVAGVLLAFVSPWIAYALYATVAAIWIIPDRRFVS